MSAFDLIAEDKPLQDKCGIIGLINPNYKELLPTALIAASGVQHRGQQGAGVALRTKKGILRYTANGLIAAIFNKTLLKRLNRKSIWTMVHCRYGTYGGYDACNLQPCQVKASNGDDILLIHNGEFNGIEKIKAMLGDKKFPDDTSDTYLFTELLAQEKGENWDEKIKSALKKVTGAYSLIIGIGDAMYLARDPHGIRPLVFGKINGGYLAASETFALNKIGAKFVREVRRGEIIRMDHDGLTVVSEGTTTPGNFCDFEWAYFERPDSRLPVQDVAENKLDDKTWMSVTEFRERCGAALAIEAPIKDASFVVGVPDSGIALGTGYASALGAPYRQVIIRHHFDLHGGQRLFMRDDEINLIGKRVLGKLSLVRDPRIWKGAKVVIADDSIVRGNVCSRLTKAIKDAGAAEVHWIIGFPPVAHPCHLGVSMRSGDELVAYKYRGDTKKIAEEFGATSVSYISHRGFLKARILSGQLNESQNEGEIFLRNGSCGGCITGNYPVNRDGSVNPNASQQT